MAAQPFRFATPPPSARPTSLAFTKYLVIWETEGSHAQELQNTLIAATKAGLKPSTSYPAEAKLVRRMCLASSLENLKKSPITDEDLKILDELGI